MLPNRPDEMSYEELFDSVSETVLDPFVLGTAVAGLNDNTLFIDEEFPLATQNMQPIIVPDSPTPSVQHTVEPDKYIALQDIKVLTTILDNMQKTLQTKDGEINALQKELNNKEEQIKQLEGSRRQYSFLTNHLLTIINNILTPEQKSQVQTLVSTRHINARAYAMTNQQTTATHVASHTTTSPQSDIIPATTLLTTLGFMPPPNANPANSTSTRITKRT